MKSIISLIPNGIYCYSTNRGKGRCPYHEIVEYQPKNVPEEYKPFYYRAGLNDEDINSLKVAVRGRCNLLQIEDEFPQDLSLLWDQCKLCGINDGWDDENHDIHMTTSKDLNLLLSGKAC